MGFVEPWQLSRYSDEAGD